MKVQSNKGITLVALIITIIILLILSVVAIREVTGDGIITKAKQASSDYTIAQEKEEVQLAIMEWQLASSATGTPTLSSYLGEKYGTGNAQLNEDDSITVTVPSGNRYVVTGNGEATLLDGTVEEPTPALPGVTLSKTEINQSIASGSTATDTLTATLVNATGDLIWTTSDADVAELSGEGNTRTVTLKKVGTATITVSYGEYSATCSVTVTEKAVPAIGDKVAYNEGSGKTSTVDSAFAMDNLEWRVLDVEADGTIELISTKPTTSKLTLSGQEGWLSAEENLDQLCNDLYANGTGVTARSLKVEDVDKLGNYDPTTYSGYGARWQYQYSTSAGYMQYRKSTDNGATWDPDWTNITSSSYQTFTEPGEETISSTNTSRIADLTSTYYYYTIADKVSQTTTDGISMASLISQGLNDTNDAASGSNVTQWLSSRCVYCTSGYAYFSVRRVNSGNVHNGYLWYSNGNSNSPAYAVRPVVSLPSSVSMTKVDGVWQVNI